MGSDVGQADLTGKASCEAGGLGAKLLELLNGLNGPRGKGSTRGRGGNRRSMSVPPTLLAGKERTLLIQSQYEFLYVTPVKGHSRKRALAGVVTRHWSHVFEHHGLSV